MKKKYHDPRVCPTLPLYIFVLLVKRAKFSIILAEFCLHRLLDTVEDNEFVTASSSERTANVTDSQKSVTNAGASHEIEDIAAELEQIEQNRVATQEYVRSLNATTTILKTILISSCNSSDSEVTRNFLYQQPDYIMVLISFLKICTCRMPVNKKPSAKLITVTTMLSTARVKIQMTKMTLMMKQCQVNYSYLRVTVRFVIKIKFMANSL